MPSQLITDGFCFSNLIAISVESIGDAAIKMPTLLNSRLLIATINKIFAVISQTPEIKAYFFHSPGFATVVGIFSVVGLNTSETSSTPILTPKRAKSISCLSILVIKIEKPEKNMAAAQEI